MKNKAVLDKKLDAIIDGMFQGDDDAQCIADAEVDAILFITGEVDSVGIDRGTPSELEEDEPEDAAAQDIESSQFVGILNPKNQCPKTDADLDRIIDTLREDRKNLPEHSTLDEPNWKMIDAQIEICEWAKGE